jgi:mannosylglycerate hydrolase MGH1-like protein
MSAEKRRLAESAAREKHWKRWGPYLSERAWGTVREDYSADGDAWNYFPHDHARSRVYRWTEDGLLGISDNHQRLCFALALWNRRDHILKERLFGLNGPEGNHGEDVKEIYYYLDATPTNSYLKALYKYPQAAYPYSQLVEESRKRGRDDSEFEIEDTGVFAESRYFDVFVEYARNDVDDILIRIRIANRGPDTAELFVLPTLWFRNTWAWGRGDQTKPQLWQDDAGIVADHHTLGRFRLTLDGQPSLLFTDNETDNERIFGSNNTSPYCKDAFHEFIIGGHKEAVRTDGRGTKACGLYPLKLAPSEETSIFLRLSKEGLPPLDRPQWDSVFAERLREANEFYSDLCHHLEPSAKAVQRQAFAGLFWSKQYYHFVVEEWLAGDPTMPVPPASRKLGRDHTWVHLFNEDVISMPDNWEYPWYAAWDLAFHTVAIAPVDPDFSKSQLELFLREWYMRPNGQIPAYEWALSDVNPPVHAWACWRVFKIDQRLQSNPDHRFLERCFHKLLMNFTWWINRKDSEQNNIFEGGFLGLDNIGVFDRSAPLPTGGVLEQSDGTAWMAGYCLAMLRIALELAIVNETYEDIASKFFEHFLYIANALSREGGTGLWDEEDGFFYDRLKLPDGTDRRIRIRSLVGLVPLFACDTIEPRQIEALPGFRKRVDWFIEHRPDLTSHVACMKTPGVGDRRLLSLVTPDRLKRILQRLFDEEEFLSPHGIRSLSRYHAEHPYILPLDGASHAVQYEPAESRSGMFGGNSNWRGPVWFPMNFLLVDALQRYDYYYGQDFKIEFPTGSGQLMSLWEAAKGLSQRLSAIFLPDGNGKRPVYDDGAMFQDDPHFRDYVLFYEYFHGDTGAGLGASHQTGWTGLVAKLLQQSGVGK